MLSRAGPSNNNPLALECPKYQGQTVPCDVGSLKMADNTKCLRDDRNVCSLCGALENLSLCGGCRKTWYCCKEHQKADWKEHKKRCNAKKKLKDKNSVMICADSSKTDSCRKKSHEPAGDDLSTHVRDKSGVGEKKTHGSNINKTKQASANSIRVCASADDSGSETDSSGSSSVQVPQEGSSEAYVLETAASSLSLRSTGLSESADRMRNPRNPLDSSDTYVTILKSRFLELADYVTNCLTKYGICVIDKFLGDSKGLEILEEVKHLHQTGVFQNGQVVDARTSNTATRIRGDMITWVDGTEDGYENILFLISCMDDVILQCAGKLEHYKISERTKAMVACYPGQNTGYIRHVDNPNGDGRCVTSIYYLNRDWEVKKHGGLLRIFPEGNSQVANIEPVFDRLLFFWSDRRNPHEVQNATKERYAITVWYYDTEERSRALKRFKGNRKEGKKTAVPLINGDRKF